MNKKINASIVFIMLILLILSQGNCYTQFQRQSETQNDDKRQSYRFNFKTKQKQKQNQNASNKSNKKQQKQTEKDSQWFVNKVIAFITKIGLKVLVSPKVLKVQIKIIVEKLVKVSLKRAVLKKIPVVGAITGVGLSIWRLVNKEYGMAAAELASGLSGATGIGAGASLGIDYGILIVDVINALIDEKIIEKPNIDIYQKVMDFIL